MSKNHQQIASLVGAVINTSSSPCHCFPARATHDSSYHTTLIHKAGIESKRVPRGGLQIRKTDFSVRDMG